MDVPYNGPAPDSQRTGLAGVEVFDTAAARPDSAVSPLEVRQPGQAEGSTTGRDCRSDDDAGAVVRSERDVRLDLRGGRSMSPHWVRVVEFAGGIPYAVVIVKLIRLEREGRRSAEEASYGELVSRTGAGRSRRVDRGAAGEREGIRRGDVRPDAHL